jgi:hypothetical protein
MNEHDQATFGLISCDWSHTSLVCGVTIDNEKHHLIKPVDKSLHEIDKLAGAYPTPDGHKAEFSFYRFAVKLRRTSTTLLGVQSVPATGSVVGQPSVYRDAVDPQGLSYNIGTLSFLNTGNCTFATRSTFCGLCLSHPSFSWMLRYNIL